MNAEDELIERSQPGPELICASCGHDQAFHMTYSRQSEQFVSIPCDFEKDRLLAYSYPNPCGCENFSPMTAEDGVQ